MKDFGKKLKELREKNGLTQQQLADRIWVTKSTISNYELGERNPSPEILIKLSNVFHISVDSLLGIEKESPVLSIEGLTDEDIELLEKTIELLRRKNMRERDYSEKRDKTRDK
ncbi:MAG: helix-turn-helix domain-containing protein [Ruminiclostridium sp.]